jgi:hypothetical protein
MSGYVTGILNAYRSGKGAAQRNEPRNVCPYRRDDYIISWNQGYDAGRQEVSKEYDDDASSIETDNATE